MFRNCLLFSFALYAVFAIRINAQEPKMQGGEFRYLGTLECTVCHVAPAIKYNEENVTDFVYLDEYKNWLKNDPHSKSYSSIIPAADKIQFARITRRLSSIRHAFNIVASRLEPVEPVFGESNLLSRRIIQQVSGADDAELEQFFLGITENPAQLLDGSLTSNVGLMTTAKQCFSCHVGWDLRQKAFDEESVRYATGVGCEGCHGASSEWIDRHKRKEWREISPEKKETDFGLFDTRQPVKKSKMCLSCHIGNIREGKFVTHAMYAAGHPPLPSIEIEFFSDQLPRHWRTLNEKDDFVSSTELSSTQFRKRFAESLGMNSADLKYDHPRSKGMLIGAILATSHATKLLADSAEQYLMRSGNNQGDDQLVESTSWPDYATFDCVACHHDLKRNGDYRKFAGTPGRPPFHQWPKFGTKIALAYLEATQDESLAKEFFDVQSDLQKVLDQQPFGIAKDLIEAGNKFENIASKVANKVQSNPLRKEDLKQLLGLMVGEISNPLFDPQKEDWEFHSARQFVWGLKTVMEELEIEKHKELLNGIGLSRFIELPGPGDITTNQTSYLTAWSEFNRKDFVNQIGRLRQSLSESSQQSTGEIQLERILPAD